MIRYANEIQQSCYESLIIELCLIATPQRCCPGSIRNTTRHVARAPNAGAASVRLETLQVTDVVRGVLVFTELPAAADGPVFVGVGRQLVTVASKPASRRCRVAAWVAIVSPSIWGSTVGSYVFSRRAIWRKATCAMSAWWRLGIPTRRSSHTGRNLVR